MAYRITYEHQTIKMCSLSARCKFTSTKKILTVLMIVVIMGHMLFNKNARKHLLPGDPEITERALNNMVVNIQEGEPFVDAMTEFCKEILENA